MGNNSMNITENSYYLTTEVAYCKSTLVPECTTVCIVKHDEICLVNSFYGVFYIDLSKLTKNVH